MYSKRLLAAAVALLSAGSAKAQIEAGGLDFVDPWGVGYLSSQEQPLPKTLWSASNASDLMPLMQTARTRNLSPAERVLMRRLLLSSGLPPRGERSDRLLAERARLMYELGETPAAIDLLPKLSVMPGDIVADELATDLQFALGQDADACDSARRDDRDGEFWVKARIVCLALEGDVPATGLAVELALTQGVDDPWLFSSVLAVADDVDGKPAAKFDTGLHLAVSHAAGLALPDNALSRSRPDLAQAIAIRESFDPALRVQAAGVAAESGLLSGEDHRRAYDALRETGDFRATKAIEVALVIHDSAEATTTEKARILAEALRSAKGASARFSAAARLVQPMISSLQLDEDTARYAPVFAAALLAADDPDGAFAWAAPQTGPDPEDEVEDEQAQAPILADPFELAWLRGLAILAGASATPEMQVSATNKLVELADEDARGRAAQRLLSLMTVEDIRLAPPARRALRTLPRENPENHAEIPAASILAAAKAGAAGEAVLLTLNATRGDASRIAPDDLIVILTSLQRLKLDGAARQLAVEATGYWKVALG